MRCLKLSMIGVAMIFCAGGLTLNVMADQGNKKTILTITEKIQIPGATLTPGKYVFKLMDSSSNRHIVQVFNEEENQVLSTILAIPNYRLRPSGKTEFGFWEMPKDSPPALRSWFYPGDNFGQEFAYPKSEASRIAAGTKEQVPSISAEEHAKLADEVKSKTASNQQTQITSAQTPSDQSRAVAGPEEKSTTPSPPPSQTRPGTQSPADRSTSVAQSTSPAPKATPAAPASDPSQVTTRRPVDESALPKTASPFPLIGLGGVLAVGIAFVWRSLRRLP